MTISHESAERIDFFHQVAKVNGSLVSVKDLSRLLGEGATESEVADAVESIPFLSSRFELRGDFLTEREGGRDFVERETNSRRRAQANLRQAVRFVSFLHSNPLQMIAVSGSTSYGSAALSKDLDLFCVAPKDRMWIALTEGLLMARAYRFVNKSAPIICLSCLMDESFAKAKFASQRDPLFARDAVETKVIKGHETYQLFMKKADWISELYPTAYRRIVESGVSSSAPRTPSAWDRVLNKLLFETIGRYVKVKASMANRRLRNQGRKKDLFEMQFGEDHLIYESRRYSNLRDQYRSLSSSQDGHLARS